MAIDLPALVQRLVLDTSELEKGIGKSSKSIGTFAGVGKAAFFTIGTAALGFAGVAVAAALKGEQAHVRLTNAISHAGPAFQNLGKLVEDNVPRFAKLGYENDDLETSIAKLVPVTKNAKEAMSLMGLAADIARGRNISLDTATQLLVKVQTGHVSLLGRLGIATKDANGKTITSTEALQKLTSLYGGAAQASAETFAGKMRALKAEAANLTEQVGNALIPVLETLLGATIDTVTWFEKHRVAAVALGIVIGGPLLAAMLAYGYAQAQVLAANVAGFFASIASGATNVVGPLLIMAGAEETAALSATAMWVAVIGPAALAAAAVYGFYEILHGNDSNTAKVTTHLDYLAKESLPKLRMELSEGGNVALKVFNDALKDSPVLAKKVLTAMESLTDKSPEMSAAIKTAKGELEKQSGSLVDNARNANDTAAAQASLTATLAEQAPTVKDAAKAVDDNATALQKQVDAVWGNVDAARALSTAQTQLSDDLKSGKSTDDQKLQDIEAISQAAAAQAVAQLGPGATAQQTETAGTNAQIFSLALLKNQYPQLAPVIQPYIDKLNGVVAAGGAANQVSNNAISALGALAQQYPQLQAPIQALIDKIHAQDTAISAGSDNIRGNAISALGALAAKYPELQQPIQDLIDKINKIPQSTTTTVSVDTAQAQQNLDTLIAKFGVAAAAGAQGSLSGRGATQVSGTPTYGLDGHTVVGYHAAGGPFGANAPILVGERGPELLLPNFPGVVATAGDTAKALGATSGVEIHPGAVSITINGDVDSRQVRALQAVVQRELGQLVQSAKAGRR